MPKMGQVVNPGIYLVSREEEFIVIDLLEIDEEGFT